MARWEDGSEGGESKDAINSPPHLKDPFKKESRRSTEKADPNAPYLHNLKCSANIPKTKRWKSLKQITSDPNQARKYKDLQDIMRANSEQTRKT